MDQKEFHQKQTNARAQFTRHDHAPTNDPDVRSNCSACTLAGYHPKGERRDFINNAGWARVYIQAGKFIPSNLHMAFLAELASTNRAYADALRQDINDFGINCEKPSRFFNAIREVLEIWE
jgi:hypothetical protein